MTHFKIDLENLYKQNGKKLKCGGVIDHYMLDGNSIFALWSKPIEEKDTELLANNKDIFTVEKIDEMNGYVEVQNFGSKKTVKLSKYEYELAFS